MKPRTPLVENGSYLAVCVGVLAVGEQYVDRSAFGGRSGYESQIVFVFEFPTEIGEDGKPKQLNKDVNATSAPNGSLYAIMKAWNSREYTREQLEEADLNDQLGKPCQVTVSVSESGYSRVSAVAAVPKGIPAPKTETPFICFNVEEWDDAVFAALPEWAQNKIKNSTQYQKQHAPTDIVADTITPAAKTVTGGQAWPTVSPGAGGAPF